MLEDTRRDYIKLANLVPGWQTMNKNDLINACIDHKGNPVEYNSYFAAVVLRYWGNIGKYYNASKASGFTIEDCYDWLLDAIIYILDKHKWRDPNSKLSKDRCAPDKCINRCIYSSRQQHYYTSNLDKHKVNYISTSLDDLTDKTGDHNSLLSDPIEDTDSYRDNFDLISLIRYFFKKDKVISSVVIYSLCESDCFVHKTETTIVDDKKIKKSHTEFKLYKLVDFIYGCDEQTITRMSDMLELDNDEDVKLHDYLSNLKATSKNKVKTVVKKTMESLSKEPALKEYLCC